MCRKGLDVVEESLQKAAPGTIDRFFEQKWRIVVRCSGAERSLVLVGSALHLLLIMFFLRASRHRRVYGYRAAAAESGGADSEWLPPAKTLQLLR